MPATSEIPAVKTEDQPLDNFPSRVDLKNILDLESFREIISTFCDLHRVGVKIFDHEANPISDVRIGSGAFCGHLFEYSATRKLCTQLVGNLKQAPFEIRDGKEIPRVVSCFTGMRYIVIPLFYENDYLGRLVFGPYRPKQNPGIPEKLYQIEPNLDEQTSAPLHEQITILDNQEASRILKHLEKTIEIILFSGYRATLTSQMHIEAITDSYDELQTKNQELLQTNAQLQELDRMKSNFLATVSHELRTPLTSVIGYAEMLLEGIAGDMNEEQLDFVQTIMSKGESLLSLITQLLDFTQMEVGTLRFAMAATDINDVVKEAYTSVLPQSLKDSVQLTMSSDGAMPMFFGDKDKLVQVFVNLIGNAVKFTPEGGTVHISTDICARENARSTKEDRPEDNGLSMFDLPEKEFIRIRVKDTGIGIPPEKQAKIFERFFQVDNTSTRKFGGAGLGLSIVKTIIDGHKGEISVESEPNQGTTFSVLLPIQIT